jgi:hypothetical protein
LTLVVFIQEIKERRLTFLVGCLPQVLLWLHEFQPLLIDIFYFHELKFSVLERHQRRMEQLIGRLSMEISIEVSFPREFILLVIEQ